MQKVIFILFLMILSTGCSVIRKDGAGFYDFSNELLTEKILESIKEKNITRRNFYIQKAEILIYGNNEKISLLGTVKFISPDRYLISLRSRTGIEGARIFVSNDTILVNDKINRKFYFGSPQFAKRKYGITTSLIPVILGDYITETKSDINQKKCLNGKLYINGLVSGIKIKYVIECRKGKIIAAIPENILNGERIEIKFDDFVNRGDVSNPGKIEIKDFDRMVTVEIRIGKIESPWNGIMEFIPGNKFEMIPLL